MPIEAMVDAQGFLRLTFSDAWPSLAELKTVRMAMENPGGHRLILADLRGLNGHLPHVDEIRSLIARVANSGGAAARRRAVVVSTDVQFGVARIFQSLLPGEVGVFRDEAEAVAWLIGDTGE